MMPNRSTEAVRTKMWSDRPKWNGSFHWPSALFLVVMPFASLGLATYSVFHWGFHWVDVALFLGMYLVTGLAITAGYHRLFSHRAYEANSVVRALYLVFGAGAWQNSAHEWCSDHRFHHQFVDTDSDPYNIKKGFFWAHMGWIFYSNPKERTFDNIPDLTRDRLVMLQKKYYWPLAILMGLGFPMFLGAFWDRAWPALIWGGFLRMIVVHHSTYLINSAAHYFGRQAYAKECTARDAWWMAPLSMGEAFHSFHHQFAADYRNGIRWFHWDPSKWLIFGLAQIGWARRLKRTPEWMILKSRFEAEKALAEEALEKIPVELVPTLVSARSMTERALEQFTNHRKSFEQWRKGLQEKPRQVRRRVLRAEKRTWANEIRAYRESFREALKSYRILVKKCRQATT